MKARLLIILSLSLSGCASITTGTTQSIGVEPKPAGAECQATNDKGAWMVRETPGTVTAHRSYDPLNVVCAKGKMKGPAALTSSTKGAAYGNILFGGVIGGAIDMGNGAAYDYAPSVFVRLK